MQEPDIKRAVAFFDGQNLYRHAKEAFGHHHPNYDPIKLTNAVCKKHGWLNRGVRYYTGTPSAIKAPMWHQYWANRLLGMRRAGILVVDRRIRYHEETFTCEHGKQYRFDVPHEKGIDVRLALDVVRLTRASQLDVALIFSQDQDLCEVADDIREIAAAQGRWIKIVSAFPSSPTATAARGIDKTDWFPMDQKFYDACLDPRDYRPKSR
ncbi:MAG TPA: NYN domain-containing protein [Stellaceae bacterium]|nr:NYN domain-containing protein [Stellaceae bacterium]